MRAILDEGVPRKLIPELRKKGCEVAPFPNDWKGLKNGKLLDTLERAGFDCLVTCDKNIAWQQSLNARALFIVVLPFQKLVELVPIADRIADAVRGGRGGQIVRIELGGFTGNDDR